MPNTSSDRRHLPWILMAIVAAALILAAVGREVYVRQERRAHREVLQQRLQEEKASLKARGIQSEGQERDRLDREREKGEQAPQGAAKAPGKR